MNFTTETFAMYNAINLALMMAGYNRAFMKPAVPSINGYYLKNNVAFQFTFKPQPDALRVIYEVTDRAKGKVISGLQAVDLQVSAGAKDLEQFIEALQVQEAQFQEKTKTLFKAAPKDNFDKGLFL